MKFSLKKLFSRKGKKEAAAPPAAASTAPVAVPEAPKPVTSPVNDRLDALAQYKQPEGYYLIDLNVTTPGASHGGASLHMIQSPQTGLNLALFSPQELSGCKTIAVQAEDHMNKVFNLDVGHTYYKRKGAEFFFDGYDQLLGLPPGDGFQLVLVPEGCDWKPDYVPPLRYAIPGTSTVLQHPATLLPQFQPQVQYPIIMVNGYDITRPVLPEMPKAQAKPEEPKTDPKADASVQAPSPPPAPKP